MKFAAVLACVLLAAPLAAKDRLGVYQGWAAFRDPATPRCYAISAPEETVGTPTRNGYLSIGFWPKRRVTHQIYVRLSRERSTNSGITLSAGGRRFRLKVDGNSGWATDRRMDLAIIAAMLLAPLAAAYLLWAARAGRLTFLAGAVMDAF